MARRDRSAVRVVVVGGGSWGSAFACVLRDRGHDVTFACRDAEQARAIAETGRNPRYLKDASLREAPEGKIDPWLKTVTLYDQETPLVTQTTVTDPGGNPMTYRFNSQGFTLARTDALGETTSFEYHPGSNQLVSTTDPLTLLATGTLLVGAAALASWVPARRAVRLDPAISLRSE